MGFVPDKLNDQAEVFIYAQNPGDHEELGERWTGTMYEMHKPEPLIGKTGYALDKDYLPKAGLSRDAVSVGNTIRCRDGDSNNLPPLGEVKAQQALLHCHLNHFKLPPATKLIVAQGEYALYAMTQRGLEKNDGITDWRGYLLPYQPIGSNWTFYNDIWMPAPSRPIPVYATYHIAFTFRSPIAGLITMLDFQKISRILKGTWPEQLPLVKEGPPQKWPAVAAFDTEYVPENKFFLMYSMYDGNQLRVSQQLDPGVIMDGSKYHLIMHNSPADLTFVERMFMGIPFSYDDTMHAHAVLWSDFPHDLGFLGSLYANINRWKHLMQTNSLVYSAADALATWDVWEHLKQEFTRDQQSWNIYKNIQLRLVPIIRDAEAMGIRVNQDVVDAHWEREQVFVQEQIQQAHAILGWPLNLRSNDQVKHELFGIQKLTELIRNRR